ncbi:MAG TPA: lipoate--protein ligase family protein [Chlamydiales bacterium]|jgi:lipoate-protein ligase A|nr:lipoate--protein ligase family protein [Chlamydiales bacterium]
MNTLHLLQTEKLHIFDQLKIEEAVLRGTDLNFCLINQGSPRAIVMGISGHPEQLINIGKVQQDQIPVIQRFSGGGTVIVDESTLFVSFIFAKSAIPIHPFPEPILRWSGDLYTACWKIPGFHLIENDYAIGALKCGGNAQYIQKDRWLHHTTFLWDYKEENMDYLLFPAKHPKYRANRSHNEFLCRLNQFAKNPQTLIDQLHRELSNRFHIQPIRIQDIQWAPHRQSLRWVYPT